jgi:Spy/CpxP family protein refolding chaperone
LRKLFGLALLLGAVVGVPTAVAYASGRGGHCGGHSQVSSAEELRAKLDRPAGWLLGKVDATDEQAASIEGTLDRVAPELFALKAEHAEIRAEFRDALTAEQINPAEVEAVRVEGLALADEASRVVAGAVVEIAKVLTVEQRGELAELADRFHK